MGYIKVFAEEDNNDNDNLALRIARFYLKTDKLIKINNFFNNFMCAIFNNSIN